MRPSTRLKYYSSYESFDWVKANLNIFYRLHHFKLHQIILSCTSSLFRFALFSPKTVLVNDFLITQSFFRKDLNDDFKLIAKILSPKYSLIKFRSYDRFCFPNIRLKDFNLAWRLSIKIANEWGKKHTKVVIKVFFFLRILEGLKFLNQLDRQACSPKSVLATMEMQFFENLFVQWTNFRGGVTYGYQHGYYRDSGPSVTAHSTNPTNYLANVSQFVLLWGKKSELVYDKYSKTKYISVGKVSVPNFGCKLEKVKNEVNDRLNFVVLLDSHLQLLANHKILAALARSCGEDTTLFYVKHPDDRNDYSSFGEEITHSKIELSRCLIFGNNSSVVLQYGALGFDVCLYEKSDFIDNSILVKDPNKFEFKSYGGIKFVYFNSKISADFWKSFICAMGEDCLTKIKEHI